MLRLTSRAAAIVYALATRRAVQATVASARSVRAALAVGSALVALSACASLQKEYPDNPYAWVQRPYQLQMQYSARIEEHCDLKEPVCPFAEKELEQARIIIGEHIRRLESYQDPKRYGYSIRGFKVAEQRISTAWADHRRVWLRRVHPDIAARECPRTTSQYQRSRAEALAMIFRLDLLVTLYGEQLELCRGGDPRSCDTLSEIERRYRSLSAATSRVVRDFQGFSLQSPPYPTEDVAERYKHADQAFADLMRGRLS